MRCAIADDQVAALPAPHGTPALKPDVEHDEGHSLSAWYGRMFGRTHWQAED